MYTCHSNTNVTIMYLLYSSTLAVTVAAAFERVWAVVAAAPDLLLRLSGADAGKGGGDRGADVALVRPLEFT